MRRFGTTARLFYVLLVLRVDAARITRRPHFRYPSTFTSASSATRRTTVAPLACTGRRRRNHTRSAPSAMRVDRAT
ncbi:hypothetical protein CUJ89_32835 [Burkholderia pyrrocinia]|uniref:Uncharacterized protein n=1 Tax=Burkholderia pyrrocinia TaxID=60550 RepID=A0A2Z5N724_BURPY|nr:hypothetical protein CUJ89_32835 [Burkholderia pyrrocinia]